MTLEELEKRLINIRKEEEVTFKMLKDRGLSSDTISNIHEGKEYKLSSLFKYLDALMYVIEVNGVTVSDIKGFGNLLRIMRQNKNLSLAQVQAQLGWTPRQVIAIEKGRGYTRNSLLKYTSLIEVNYELESVFDLPSDIRENLYKDIDDIESL